MWFVVLCAAVVAGGLGAGAAVAPGPDSLNALTPLDLLQIDSSAPDDEALSYAVPHMERRYAAGSPWLYLLANVPRDSQVASASSASLEAAPVALRRRRGFSVNPAVEVLQRGAYHTYIERLANKNRNFLDCVGKRDPSSADCTLKN